MEGTRNGTLWKMIAVAGWSLVLPLLLAWFTAFRDRGMTSDEVHSYVIDYVSKYTPYSFDKAILADHVARQDASIGANEGKIERLFTRVADIEKKEEVDNHDRADIQTKMAIVKDLLEAQQRLKR